MKLKLGHIKLLIIEFIILLSLLFYKVIYINNIWTIVFLSIILLTLIFCVGYEKDKHLYKIDVIQKIIIYCFIYYLITYVLGLLTGFLKNSYNLNFLSILKNVIPYIIIITLLEIIRYIVISKSKEKKFIFIIITILITIIDIMLIHGSYSFETYKSSFLLTSIYIFPAFAKNIFLSYTTYYYGYKPCLIYRFMMEIPLFILPIFPNFGNYIDSIVKLVLPVLLYFKIDRVLIKKDKTLTNKRNYKKLNIILIIFTLIIVYFTCGLFRYYALAVGSESMSPNVNLGDVVIVEKVSLKNLNTLKKGDILVYKHDDKTIVHRIAAISKINNKYIFRTKGDHNESSDNYDISEKDVIGKVDVKISYIGYPVVWINKLFAK